MSIIDQLLNGEPLPSTESRPSAGAKKAASPAGKKSASTKTAEGKKKAAAKTEESARNRDRYNRISFACQLELVWSVQPGQEKSNSSLTIDRLEQLLGAISSDEWDEVIEERVTMNACGWVLCNRSIEALRNKHKLVLTKPTKGPDAGNVKLCDAAEIVQFCSKDCKAHALMTEKLLSPEPLWARQASLKRKAAPQNDTTNTTQEKDKVSLKDENLFQVPLEAAFDEISHGDSPVKRSFIDFSKLEIEIPRVKLMWLRSTPDVKTTNEPAKTPTPPPSKPKSSIERSPAKTTQTEQKKVTFDNNVIVHDHNRHYTEYDKEDDNDAERPQSDSDVDFMAALEFLTISDDDDDDDDSRLNDDKAPKRSFRGRPELTTMLPKRISPSDFVVVWSTLESWFTPESRDFIKKKTPPQKSYTPPPPPPHPPKKDSEKSSSNDDDNGDIIPPSDGAELEVVRSSVALSFIHSKAKVVLERVLFAEEAGSDTQDMESVLFKQTGADLGTVFALLQELASTFHFRQQLPGLNSSHWCVIAYVLLMGICERMGNNRLRELLEEKEEDLRRKLFPAGLSDKDQVKSLLAVFLDPFERPGAYDKQVH